MLARLLKQPGAMVVFEREELIDIVQHIQHSKRNRTVIAGASGMPQLPLRRSNTHGSPSARAAQSPSVRGIGSDDGLTSNDNSSTGESSDAENPARRGVRTQKRGVMRDLLNFELPRPTPRRRREARQNRRWTWGDKRKLRELKT